jgi:hypothetical protein
VSANATYAELARLVQSMEEDLGLTNLRNSDKKLFACIVLLSEDGQQHVSLKDIKEHALTKALPSPSLFSSLKRLMNNSIIKKIGSERSATYQLN